MKIGVPKEIKNNEYRVGLLPVGVEMLLQNGHKVYIEAGAGLGSGISDETEITHTSKRQRIAFFIQPRGTRFFSSLFAPQNEREHTLQKFPKLRFKALKRI